jgi:hypothetical protein
LTVASKAVIPRFGVTTKAKRSSEKELFTEVSTFRTRSCHANSQRRFKQHKKNPAEWFWGIGAAAIGGLI